MLGLQSAERLAWDFNVCFSQKESKRRLLSRKERKKERKGDRKGRKRRENSSEHLVKADRHSHGCEESEKCEQA